MLLDSLRRMVAPLTLSRAVEVAYAISSGGRRNGRNHYYYPVQRLQQFLGEQRAERPNTLSREELISLGDIPVKEVTPDDIVAWYRWLGSVNPQSRGGRRLSPATINSYARMAHAFFRHLVTAGHLDASPARALRITSPPKKGKKGIPPDAIEKLVKHSKRSWRDHAIVLMLRDTGARVGELVSMRVSTVAISENGNGRLEGKARVTGKTGYRSVFFGDAACRAVREYMDYRPHDSPDDLWLNIHGDPISENGIYQMLKRTAELAGVERWNPHAFRHAFAKRMLKKGMPAKVLQELLGHQRIETTLNEYVQLDDDDLARYHADYRD